MAEARREESSKKRRKNRGEDSGKKQKIHVPARSAGTSARRGMYDWLSQVAEEVSTSSFASEGLSQNKQYDIGIGMVRYYMCVYKNSSYQKYEK